MAAPKDKPRYGYRPLPQVSANQMAAYLGASSTRRKSIIRDARFPKTSVVTQYRYAREGLTSFLDDDARSLTHLADAVDFLGKRHGKADASDWVKRDCRLSIEAIEAFQKAYNKYGLAKLDCKEVTNKLTPFNKWPTKVSVDIDVLIRKPSKGEKDSIGAALLLFSKGESSGKARVEQSRNIAGLIYVYCSEYLSGLGAADPSLCLAVDVFGGSAYKPPGTFSKGLKNVEDSCEEIAARWATTPPPDDYDGPAF